MNAHSHAIASVAFSPDGKTIVSGSYDNTLKVWDAINFRPHVESEWEQFDKKIKETVSWYPDKIEQWWRNKITGHEQDVKPCGGVHLPVEPRDAQSPGFG